MAGDSGDKKHAASSDRLTKARNDGKVPQSQEVSSALMLVMLLGLLVACAPSLMNYFLELIRRGVSFKYSTNMSEDDFGKFVTAGLATSAEAVAPFLIGAVLISIAGSLLVSGWSFAPKMARFNWARLSPISGLGNLFNSRSLVTLLVASAKLAVIAAIVYEYLSDNDMMKRILSLVYCTPLETLGQIGGLIVGVSGRIIMAMFAIAGADMIWQKWKYKHDLKMTDEEVREERKQHEGDPRVKSKMRAIQFEIARKRMLQEVPKADVILVNPTHVAVALKYDMNSMKAPVVLAKGGDIMCERIKEIARAHGVPIVHRPELARALFAQVEINEPIPEVLFVAVAEVLAMIYRLKKQKK